MRGSATTTRKTDEREASSIAYAHADWGRPSASPLAPGARIQAGTDPRPPSDGRRNAPAEDRRGAWRGLNARHGARARTARRDRRDPETAACEPRPGGLTPMDPRTVGGRIPGWCVPEGFSMLAPCDASPCPVSSWCAGPAMTRVPRRGLHKPRPGRRRRPHRTSLPAPRPPPPRRLALRSRSGASPSRTRPARRGCESDLTRSCPG